MGPILDDIDILYITIDQCVVSLPDIGTPEVVEIQVLFRFGIFYVFLTRQIVCLIVILILNNVGSI